MWETTRGLRFSYDPEADAAYLYLDAEHAEHAGAAGKWANMISAIFAPEMEGEVNLDLDAHGRVLGIEFIGASHILPTQLLHPPEG